MNGVSNSKGAVGIYDGIMLKFYAIPAKTDSGTGRVRFKIEKPVDSTGVMIRYKTNEWTAIDSKESGSFLANITDDTPYKGVNQWYETTGLPLNQDLYFCAFPYKGSSYSPVKSVNLTKCRAGGLFIEYTFDSISGTTIYDTGGNANHASGGFSVVPGIVGNAITTTSATIAQCTIPGGAQSVVGFFKGSGIGVNTSDCDGGADGFFLQPHASGHCDARWVGGGGNVLALGLATPVFTPGVFTHFAITWDGTTNANAGKLYKNGVLLNQGTASRAIGSSSAIGIGCYYNGSYHSTTTLDQIAIYLRELKDFEVENLAKEGGI